MPRDQPRRSAGEILRSAPKSIVSAGRGAAPPSGSQSQGEAAPRRRVRKGHGAGRRICMLGGRTFPLRSVPGRCPGKGSARGEGDSSVAPTSYVVFPELRGGRSLRMTGVSAYLGMGWGGTTSCQTCHSEGGAAQYFPFAQEHGADRRIFIRSGGIFPLRCVPGRCPGGGSARGEGDSSVAPLAPRFSRESGWALPQNDRCFRGFHITEKAEAAEWFPLRPLRDTGSRKTTPLWYRGTESDRGTKLMIQLAFSV